jgi:predicted Zn-dependent peptidase
MVSCLGSDTAAQSVKYQKLVHPDDPFHIQTYRYANGLTLMIRVSPERPRLQTMIGLRIGSRNDPEEFIGLAHFVEHMLMMGTDSIGTSDYFREKRILDMCRQVHEQIRNADDKELPVMYSTLDSLYQVAAQFAIPKDYHMMMYALGATRVDGGTTLDRTFFEVDIPSDMLETWLQIESERFRHPVFRLVSTEMGAVYEEYNMAANHEGMRINQTILASLFPTHPYRHPYYGKAQHLSKPSIEQAYAFFKRHYTPDNMCIVLVGDVDPDSAANLVDKYFSHYAGSDTTEMALTLDEISSPKHITLDGLEDEKVVVAYALPPKNSHRAELLAQHINKLLRHAHEFNKKIRSAYSYVLRFRDCSVHVLAADINGTIENSDDIENFLLRQIRSLKTDKINKKDIQDAAFVLTTNRKRQHTENWRSAITLVQAFSMHGWTEELNAMNELGKVEPHEILAYVYDHYKSNYVTIHKRQRDLTPVESVALPTLNPLPIDFSKRSDFSERVIAKLKAPRCIETRDPLLAIDTSRKRIVHRFSSSGKFSIQFVFNVGFAHFPLLKIVSENLSKFSEQSAIIKDLSGSVFLKTNAEKSVFMISGPNQAFEVIMDAFFKWVRHATLGKSAYDEIIREARSRWVRSRSNRDSILAAVDAYLIYGPDNPITVTSPMRLANISPDSVSKVLRDLLSYEPTVYYEGVISRDSLEHTLDRFQLWAYSYEPTPRTQLRALKQPSQRYFVRLDGGNIDVRWTVPAKSVGPECLPLLYLLNSYFGLNYPSSLLYNELRVRRGLARFLGGSYELLAGNGVLKISVTTSRDRLEDVVATVDTVLATFPRHDVAFETRRRNLLHALTSYESVQTLGQSHRIRDFCKPLMELTFEDLKTFFLSHVDSSHRSICIIGSMNVLDNMTAHEAAVELNVDQLFDK